MSNSISHFNTLSQPRTVSAAARAASRLTVRRKFLLGFLCLSIGAASLGAYAVRRVVALGSLADQAAYGSSTAISYARSASAGFAALGVAMARQTAFPNRAEAELRVDDLSRTLDGNLAAAAQRASTPQAAQAAAIAAISAAQDKMTDAKFRTLLWIGAAMIGGGMIVTLLAQRIMGSIFSLSAVICRVTAGQDDTYGANASADGAAALLTTIGTMRANIAAMTALEVAERQHGRPILANSPRKSNAGVIKSKQVELMSEPLPTHGV